MANHGPTRRERQSTYPMISVDDALVQILTLAQPLQAVKVPVTDALGCILAEDVKNPQPQPPFAASIMDGYAIVAADGPGMYPLVGRITAGIDPDKKGIVVQSGAVAYITTGAKMPQGADAVVKVEDTEEGEIDHAGNEVKVKINATDTKPGKWVRARGSDMAEGEVVLQHGIEICAAEVGLLATVGATEVKVYRRPVVGVLSTGDELVEAGDPEAAEGKIRDSNRPALLALYASELGKQNVVDLGIIKDEEGEEVFKRKVKAALDRVDVLVTSGGVSMGEADLLKPVLASLGKIQFGRLNMKPGKPTTFATIDTGAGGTPKLVFALPGNPVSCMVTSHLLVQPALRRLQGLPPHASMCSQVQIKLGSKVDLDPERPEYQRVVIRWDGDKRALVAESTGRQISSRLLSMRSANGLLCLPAGSGSLSSGEEVTAMVIGQLTPPAPTECVHSKAALLGLEGQASSAGGGTAKQESAYEGCPCCKPSTSNTRAGTATGNASGTIKLGILTVSDRASTGAYEDKSGPAMEAILLGREFISGGMQGEVVARAIVPDDVATIQKIIKHWSDELKVDAIFTSGGTGFAPRDMTPEAVRPLLTKEAPGLVFRIMQVGTKHTPLAVLSRPVAGLRGSTLVVTLPGSPKAVKENLDALLPLLPKIFSLVRTSTCDHKEEAVAPPTGR